MRTYAVIYQYDTSLLTLIDDWRPAHRTYLRQLHRAGSLFTSGFFRDTNSKGALLIMRGNSASEVRALLEKDPFFEHGLVRNVIVREWEPTIGELAERFDAPGDFPTPNP